MQPEVNPSVAGQGSSALSEKTLSGCLRGPGCYLSLLQGWDFCGASQDGPAAGLCYPWKEKGETSWSPLAKTLPDLITALRD